MEDKEYIKIIEEKWRDHRKDKIKYMSNQYWEKGKEIIKNETIKYCKQKNKFIHTKHKFYQNLINQNIKKETKEKAQEELEKIEKYRAEGIKIRTKNELTNMYEENKYLDRREEIKKGRSKYITKLITEEGREITDKETIINTTLGFYKKLYTSQNIENENIDEYLKNFDPPKLTGRRKKINGRVY